MKRYAVGFLILALLCALPGCGAERSVPGAKTPAVSPVVTQAPAGNIPTLPEGAEIIPEAGPKKIADGRLLVTNCGTYAGLYPEDGSDTQVENVAAILVENVSSQTCQYCQMTFLIEDEPAEFVLSELPAGASVWVLEANGLVISETDTFFFDDDESVFREEASLTGFTCTAGEGSLTVTNDSGEDAESLFIYYKLLHEDGSYLGGICYRVQVGGIAAGETKTVTAGHFYEGACEIVGIYDS